MTDKKIVHYTSAAFIQVGLGAIVRSSDHPGFDNEAKKFHDLYTSEVKSYDDTTGIFETLNTVYVPAGPNDSSQA